MRTSMMTSYRKGAFVKVPTIIGGDFSSAREFGDDSDFAFASATSDDGTSGFLAPTGLNNDTAFEAAMVCKSGSGS